MRLPIPIWPLLVASLSASPLLAGEFESHENIREAARQHVLAKFAGVANEDIKIQPAQLDRRLRLANCQRPLETFSPASRSRRVKQTVGVRCSGQDRWTLYVAVKAEIKKTILVAKRRLERGRIISRGDFRLERRMVSELHGGYIENPENAVGSALKVAVKRGAPLSPKQLRRPPAVKRGNQVTILGRAGGVEVRMSGTALSDGATGQRIKVRNSSSSRQVEGTVVAVNTVEVTL